MFEIITSEYSYMHSLSVLVCHFMRSEELKETMTQTEHHHLFSNVCDILTVSTRQGGAGVGAAAGLLGLWCPAAGQNGSDGAGMGLPGELKRRRDVVWERRKPQELRSRSPSLLGATLGTWVSQLRRADPMQSRSRALSPLGKLGKSCPGNIVKHLSVPFVQP